MSGSSKECDVREQIEREVQMREGAGKLLAACSRTEQALEASKSLLTSNVRILALLSQLQQMRKDQVLEDVRRDSGLEILPKCQNQSSEKRTSCLGTVAVSDLRIPLMWKDAEHFRNKGEQHCWAMFCMLQCGTEVQNTDLVMVDKMLTDICFEDPIILGPKYSLLAQTDLTLQHVQEGFKSHDLSLAATEEDLFWLPLYGNVCCRLVAQPLCMTRTIISGQLQITRGPEPRCWESVCGVLRGQELLCFQSQEDLEREEEPLIAIPIKKDTTIGVSEDHPVHIQVRTQWQGEDLTCTLKTHTPEDTRRWSSGLWEHIYEMSQWKQCCDLLVKIDNLRKLTVSKRRPPRDEIVTPSCPRESLHLSAEVRALLHSYYEKSY